MPKKYIIDPVWESEMCNLYTNGMSILEICKRYHRTYKLIRPILERHGIKIRSDNGYAVKRNKRLKDLMPEIAGDYLSGMTLTQIKNKYHLDQDNLRTGLNEYGVITRTRPFYSFDKTYFKKIDSPEKAYFLGLLYADGYNSGRRMALGLAEQDGYVVEKMKEFIKYTGPVYHVNIPDKEDGSKRQNIRMLIITDKEMAQDLIRLGCEPRKSLTVRFPTSEQVPDIYLSAFILGCFDGDGCISLFQDPKGRLNATWSLVGSTFFCQALRDILEDRLGIKTAYFKDPDRKIAVTHTTKISEVLKIYDMLYTKSCCSFWMTRKYYRFIRFIKYRKEYLESQNGDFEGHFCFDSRELQAV